MPNIKPCPECGSIVGTIKFPLGMAIEAAPLDDCDDMHTWRGYCITVKDALAKALAEIDRLKEPHTIDHRTLIKKYMNVIGMEEGVDFLEYRSDIFSDEEWAEIQILREESLDA